MSPCHAHKASKKKRGQGVARRALDLGGQLLQGCSDSPLATTETDSSELRHSLAAIQQLPTSLHEQVKIFEGQALKRTRLLGLCVVGNMTSSNTPSR